jgi:hypothetical protein
MAGLFGGPDNYDECIVDKMKGVDLKTWHRFAREPAERACQRKFESKLENNSLIDIDWSDTTDDGVVVNISENNSDFEITKAILKFSEKGCDASVDADFNIQAEAIFSSWIPGKGSAIETVVELSFPRNVHCFRTREVYGKRIK